MATLECVNCPGRTDHSTADCPIGPVAWVRKDTLEALRLHRAQGFPAGGMALAICFADNTIPLYTAPQAVVRQHSGDATDMVASLGASSPLPPEIGRDLLGVIVDEVFDGAIEDASVIEDIYRVIARRAGAVGGAPTCSCPSGGGSLRWPCAVHPPAQQMVVAVVPVGWKLAPLEPTPEMDSAAFGASEGRFGSSSDERCEVYRAMLRAAPQPPGVGAGIHEDVLTLMLSEHRIALSPEYEGQWHAELYGDQEVPICTAEGATPAEAINVVVAKALRAKQGGEV